MSAMKFVVFLAAIVAATIGNVKTEDKDELHERLLPLLLACAEKHNIAMEALQKAKETHNFNDFDNCFYACYFKSAGLMNDKGLFDKDDAVAKIKSIVSNEELVKNVQEVANVCVKVNDAPSDGDGCDRAKLLFTCIQEQKGKLSI